MAEQRETERTRSALEPIERLSEILFGLIMVLTFTSSLSVAAAERAEVRMVLIAALGCNIAWGLIDAIMYLMGCLHARGTDLKTIMAVRSAGSAQNAHAIIRESVPTVVALELRPEELERIRSRILGMDFPARPRFHPDHLRGALGVFLIVVMSTFPVILPFLFLDELPIAIRLSNAIAVAMLAFIGFAYGRASGLPPWWTSMAMTLLGCVLVGLTIALGG